MAQWTDTSNDDPSYLLTYIPTYIQSGEVIIDGAEVVEIMFDGRSHLPPGLVLTISGALMQPASPDVIPPQANWETGEGLSSWTTRGGGEAGYSARYVGR